MATQEQLFWQWFDDNSDDLMKIETGDEAIVDDLITQLGSLHPDLTFEMSAGLHETGRREFVVSAGGIKDAFPTVERLVEAAPPFEKWSVIAFRQPKENDYSVQMGSFSLAPDVIWFTCKPANGKFDVILYIRNLTKHNMEFAKQASFLLLDSALGEYAVEMKVGTIEHKPLPANPKYLELLPFSSIRTVIH